MTNEPKQATPRTDSTMTSPDKALTPSELEQRLLDAIAIFDEPHASLLCEAANALAAEGEK